GLFNEALEAYKKALGLSPDFPAAWVGCATVLFQLAQYDKAIDAWDKALQLLPGVHAGGLRLLSKLNICNWSEFDAEVSHFLSKIRQGKPDVPFALFPVSSTAADQLQCAECFVKQQPTFQPLWRGKTHCHDRIRIAYLSADFRNHPVAFLTAGLFERHNTSQFEVTGISIGRIEDSVVRRRIRDACEYFLHVDDKTDEEI